MNLFAPSHRALGHLKKETAVIGVKIAKKNLYFLAWTVQAPPNRTSIRREHTKFRHIHVSWGAFHLSELTGQTIPHRNDNFPFNQNSPARSVKS